MTRASPSASTARVWAGNGLTTWSAAEFKSCASAPSESGSGRRPRLSPQSKSVASSASWGLGRATTKIPLLHIRVPTRATRGASRYSLLPERSPITDVNREAVCVGVSKPGRGSSERCELCNPPNSDVIRVVLNDPHRPYLARSHLGLRPSGSAPSLIQWPPSCINARRPTPQEIGERPLPSK
jgi:hypothetical protein